MTQPNVPRVSVEVPAGTEVLILECSPEANDALRAGQYIRTTMDIYIPLSQVTLQAHSAIFTYAGCKVQSRMIDLNFK